MTDNTTGVSPASTNSITWLTVPDVAERLELNVSRVHQLLRDGQLVAVRREGILSIPGELIHRDADGRPAVVKHLSGVLTLLRDARFTDEEMIGWLYEPDDSLPGTPVAALRENRGTEVKRRAQAAGF